MFYQVGGSEIIRDPQKDMGIIIKGIVKNTDTLVGEIFRVADDVKDELYELCTEGFVEMVIKGNKDYKTSFEIKEEAEKK